MASSSSSSSKHLMLSYQWDNQELVSKIYQYLKNQNFTVWMDIEGGMKTNIYQCMAEGVENASAVICFLTSKYQSSQSCERELQFAQTQGVPIIPCRIERSWKPTSWLGIILAGRLMVDFRDVNDTNFEEKAGKLLEQIQLMNGSQTNLSAIPSLNDSQTTIIQDPGKVVLLPRGTDTRLNPDARWARNGVTVAGLNGEGPELNQLSNPRGVFVDDDQTVYVADCSNNRIVKWKYGARSGQVVAGGNGKGCQMNQLQGPTDVVVHKKTDSLIVADRWNYRVMRIPLRGDSIGETIVSYIDCWGLTVDDQGYLYVADDEKNNIKRWCMEDFHGTVVAGSSWQGNRLDELNGPVSMFVDRDHSVYVSDTGNDRVVKWTKGAKEGIVVAGGRGNGNDLMQLSAPRGVIVDQMGTVYVADCGNDRIMRWTKGATQGSIIAGGNGCGIQANQLDSPMGLSFDRNGNIYVADFRNHRVQRFNIEDFGTGCDTAPIDTIIETKVDHTNDVAIDKGSYPKLSTNKHFGFLQNNTNVARILAQTYNDLIKISAAPLMSIIMDIPINARWALDGITVAGEDKSGNELNQLHYPSGLHIDHDGTIYIADSYNHRIVAWVCGATSGQIVAGGNGKGDRPDQLNEPTDVIVDRENLIVCDYKNRRVVKWPRRNGTSGEAIMSNIHCWGLAMDDHGSLYVSDFKEHVVKRWHAGESDGIIVAGSKEEGSRLNQLSFPTYICVDRNHSVYVSERDNSRVTMWMDGAKEGIVVAGGQSHGYYLAEVSNPQGVVVDQLGTVYVVSDYRIIRWTRGATQISVIVNGKYGQEESKELNSPRGLSFDRQGNLNVVDYGNHRLQKFSIE